MLHGSVITNFKALAWPSPYENARLDQFVTMSLEDALTTRHPTDAWFQPVVLLPESDQQYRLSKAVFDEDVETELRAVLLDFDLPSHRAWATDEEETDVTEALLQAALSAGLPRPAVYSTAHGARLVWPLATPVSGRFAADYLRKFRTHWKDALSAPPLEMDEGDLGGWTRAFRLPRVVRDGVASVPGYLSATAEPLDWMPDEPLEEGNSSTRVRRSGDFEDPEPLLAVEWQHIPKAMQTVLLKGAKEPLFSPSGTPGRNDGFFGRGGLVSRTVSAVAAHHMPDPDIIFRALAPCALRCHVPGDPEPSLQRLWDMIHAYCEHDTEVNEVAVAGGLMAPDTLTPEILAAAKLVRDGVLEDSVAAKQVTKDAAEVVKKADAAKAEAQKVAIKESAQKDDLPWVVYTGDRSQVYVLDKRTSRYSAVPKDVLASTLERSHGGKVSFRNKTRLMAFTEVYDLVGVLARERQVHHWTPGRSDSYDAQEGILHQVSVPPAYMPDPEYSPQVDMWLQELVEDPADYPLLLDWLSCVLEVDRPTSALALVGDPGTGKTLLGLGVSAIWGVKADYKKNILEKFNEDLVKTPVLLADEGFQVESPHNANTFKEAVTARTHSVNMKNINRFDVHGCLRIITSGNSLEDVSLGVGGSPAHNAAIGERVLFIQCATGEKAKALGKRLQQWGTEDWVHKDGKISSPGKIAAHILWLRENHERVTKPGRLLVPGNPESGWQSRQAAHSVGMDGTILGALADWAARHTFVEDMGVTVDPVNWPGLVLVNAGKLHEHWTTLTNEDKRPTKRRVSHALTGLSVWNDSRPVTMGRMRVRCHAVPAEMVLEAAEQSGIGDDEQIRHRLAHGADEPNQVLSIAGD